MDLDRRQRNDIDIVSEDHLTLSLDALNIVNSPYVIDLEDYIGNNWLIVSERYTKYNVAEEDMLGFMVDKIPDLAQKNITEMILGFDYAAADNMIISNVSFSHDDMAELELVNYAIKGTGHIDISCDVFGLDEEVLNNIIVNQGFIIGINFNGDNSNASLKIWNVKLSFKFTNKLLGESNSVVNRLVPQVDFWRDGDDLYLQIGDGSGKGHVDEQYIDTYTKEEIDNKLLEKVDTQIGKGLSSNDYTLTEKTKLASVEANANYYTHPSTHNSSIIINSNTLTNIDTSANATQSEINQAIDDTLGNKQDGLISGENIKTINNNSILGSGNITIQGGGGGSVIGTGSFSIDNNGHLIVELPDAVDNPYYINANGHLIYDTSNTHNGE